MSIRYIRYYDRTIDQPAYGMLEDDKLTRLSQPPWHGVEPDGESQRVEQLQLLAPVEPSKIICIGLNYHAHVDASQSAEKAPDYPLIFFKPPSAVVGPSDDIVHPSQSERVDYEAELGVIIGHAARNVSSQDAERHIFGFTCVNDVTARDLQKKDGQWSRAKGFDTFCPVGPWIVPQLNHRDVLVEGVHNGEVKQSGRTSLMIFDVAYLISYISSIMTLYPGDLISTGTPSGIAPMKPGDTIEVKIEGIGSLENQMA
jgi:2-keto-4-pentenoate hydratase/2-oxohepta-3-ene-1,7-dioic acid hydratase in catechol pathway